MCNNAAHSIPPPELVPTLVDEAIKQIQHEALTADEATSMDLLDETAVPSDVLLSIFGKTNWLIRRQLANCCHRFYATVVTGRQHFFKGTPELLLIGGKP